MLTKLHVVSSLFNPWRYETRGIHYDRFRRHVQNTHMCQLHVGEVAFGQRPFEYTTGHKNIIDGGETIEYQFRTNCELWHKERVLNRLVQELPPDWEYVAWIDADIQFMREDWAAETVHLLQHYDVIQMFSHAQNLDTHFTVPSTKSAAHSFIYGWEHKVKPAWAVYGQSFHHGHPGFAWGFTRKAYESLGGFLDIAILESADTHMALSLVNQFHVPFATSPGYTRALKTWDARAQEFIKHNVGYMPGLINHYYHGSHKNRKYNERWAIIEKYKYDPDVDLKPDSQGLWQYTTRCPDLEYDIRRYFMTRLEDMPSLAEHLQE